MRRTAPPDGGKAGIKLRGWVEWSQARSGGFRPRRQQPAQGRVRGADITVRASATYAPYEKQTKGTVRAYLERPEASPEVLAPAYFEEWLDRWGIWINPSEPNADPHVILGVLKDELERRYGIDQRDVYMVRHVDQDRDGRPHYDYHAVVPAWVIDDEETGAAHKVEITREDMTAIAREMARELVLERQLERTLSKAAEDATDSSSGGRWNAPPTERQMAVLNRHGVAARDITRGEASLVIEEITGERSWVRDGGRDR